MSLARIALMATLVAATSACTMTKEFAATDFTSPQGGHRFIVMEPNVSVGILTMGGVVEPNEEWTNKATENILNALARERESRGGDITVAMTLADAGGDTAALRDLVSLHNAVGQAIFRHKYYGQTLATKKDKFDWTLGESAVEYGAQSGYDYALFLRVESSYASDARKTMQVAGLLSCAVGVCVGVSGGHRLAFASLVDLKSGQVTWFNTLSSTVGDIRTQEGADQLVATLLETLSPDSAL